MSGEGAGDRALFHFGGSGSGEVVRLSLSDKLRRSTREAGFSGAGEAVTESSGTGEEFGRLDAASGEVGE